jgi:putative transposase
MVVGFAVSSSLRAELAVDALEMAVARRGPHLTGLIHHSDRGSQYLSLRYTQRLADAGIAPSVGTAGDSYDNALAESFIGLYKTELIDNPTLAKIWAGRRHVEHGTAAYLYWFNTRRFHSACDDLTPAAYELAYHAAQQPTSA